MTSGTDARTRSTIFSTWGLALMLVLGLVLGFGAGLLTQTDRTPGDDSAEAGFARDMSSHHAQAVQMAMIAAAKAQSGSIRVIASDIALTQQAQIGIMSQWLRDWDLNANSDAPPMAWMPDGKDALQDGRMPGMATSAEIAALEQATGEDVDRMFLELMIKHHLGGIHMVDGVLDESDNEDVTWLAQSMKTGQQGEVTVLNDLLQNLDK